MTTPTSTTLIYDETECGCYDHNDCEGTCWPSSTTQKFLVQGGLADRVRARLGQETDTEVILIEERYDGGYSEYTVETDWRFAIQCGGSEILFHETSSWSPNGLILLENWLEESE